MQYARRCNVANNTTRVMAHVFNCHHMTSAMHADPSRRCISYAVSESILHLELNDSRLTDCQANHDTNTSWKGCLVAQNALLRIDPMNTMMTIHMQNTVCNLQYASA